MWLFGARPSAEEEERRIREAKVQGMLTGGDDDLLGKVYDARLVRRIWHYITPYNRQLILSVILVTITSLLYAAAPWVVGKAVDEGIRTGDLTTLRGWSIAFLLVVSGEWIANRSRIIVIVVSPLKAVVNPSSPVMPALVAAAVTLSKLPRIALIVPFAARTPIKLGTIAPSADLVLSSLSPVKRLAPCNSSGVTCLASISIKLSISLFSLSPEFPLLTRGLLSDPGLLIDKRTSKLV